MSKKKVAHVMLSMQPKKAAEVLKELDEHAILEVGEAVLKYAHLDNTKKDTGEYLQGKDKDILIKESSKKSSLEVVKALYKISFGSKKSKDLVNKLLRRQMMKRLSFLNLYKSSDILECIKSESAMVIGIVLGAMQADKASQVLLLLPFDMRVAVMKTLAKQKMPDETVINIIEQKISKRLHEITEWQTEQAGGVKNISHILKHLSVEAQDSILNRMNDTNLKDNIMENMDLWDMFTRLETKHLEEIIANFSTEELASLSCAYGMKAKYAISLGLSTRNQTELDEEIALIKAKKKPVSPNIRGIKNDIFEEVRKTAERFSYNVNVSTSDEVEYVE